MSGQYNPACVSAVQSTFIQTGVQRELNSIDGMLQSRLNSLNPNQPALTYLGIAYKIGVDKRFSYSLTNVMACDRVSVSLDQANVGIGFEWRW
jgi:hypothetical protein